MYWKTISVVFSAVSVCRTQSPNGPAVDWIQRREDGAYRFGYATGDEGRHYHAAVASADNTVAGRYGSRDPSTGADVETRYTAGRRGFRAQGPHIARHMDLSQSRPPFSRPENDGQYRPELDNIFDPNEDRGYDFGFRSKDQVKQEQANAVGDVEGRFSYLDDVGARHSVGYIAGSKTGFQVTNVVPDSFAQVQASPLYFVGKKPGSKARGYTAVQKGLDGSYRFAASGPDHKRTEIKDAAGNTRGTYTYLDDKGVQHTVEYIAGANIGYKVINNPKGVPFNPTFPYFSDLSTALPALDLSTPSPSPFPSLGPTRPSVIPTLDPDQSSLSPNFPLDPTSPSISSNPSSSTGLFTSTSPSISSNPSSSTGLFTSTPTLPSSPTSPPFSSSRPPISSTPLPWTYFDDFLSPKDWSAHTKIASSTKVTLKTPRPPPPPQDYDFGYLHHQLFPDEGLKTAESGRGLSHPFKGHTEDDKSLLNFGDVTVPPFRTNGLEQTETTHTTPKSKVNVFRGNVKYHGVSRPEEGGTGYQRIPSGVAVRAHVQSLDIVPWEKRYVSPGEALEGFNKHKVKAETAKNSSK